MHTNPLAPLLDIVLQRTQRSGIGSRAILAGATRSVAPARPSPQEIGRRQAGQLTRLAAWKALRTGPPGPSPVEAGNGAVPLKRR